MGEIMVTPMFISASQNNTCKASFVLTLYISPVMADYSFSLRAVFMLIGQRASQMGGTFSLGDVHSGRIWNGSFGETVYDLLVL